VKKFKTFFPKATRSDKGCQHNIKTEINGETGKRVYGKRIAKADQKPRKERADKGGTHAQMSKEGDMRVNNQILYYNRSKLHKPHKNKGVPKTNENQKLLDLYR